MNNETDRPISPIVQFKRDIEVVATRDLTMLDDKAKAREFFEKAGSLKPTDLKLIKRIDEGLTKLSLP